MKTCIKCKAVFDDEMRFCPECGAKYVMYDPMSYKAEACPIIVAEKSIAIADDKTIIRVILGNICDTEVSAVSITLKCYDQFGDALQDTIVKFNDLMTDTDECFGEDKIITPVDADTRRFDVIINKIVFDDGSLWNNNGNAFTADRSFTYLRDSVNTEFIEQKHQAVWEALRAWHNEYYDYVVNQGKEIYAAVRALAIKIEEEEKKVQKEDPSKKARYMWEIMKQEDLQDHPEIETLRKDFDSVITKRNDILRTSPEIVIPDGVSEIPTWCFADRILNPGDNDIVDTYQEAPVTSVLIPASVTRITDYSFFYCRNLKTVIIDNGVKEIGDHAFAQAIGLSDFSIPDSVDLICHYAFSGCESLKEMKVPKHVKEVADFSFCNSGIEKIEFFGASTKIGYRAFDSCKNLKEVILPPGLECISSSAFRNCDSLAAIVIPASLKNIAVFSYDKDIVTIKDQYYRQWADAADDDPKKYHEYWQAYQKYEKLAKKACENKEPDIVSATAENLKKYNVFPKDCKFLSEKEIKIRQYWNKHSEEKQRLESELNDLKIQLSQLSLQLDIYKNNTINLENNRDSETDLEKEKKVISRQISSLKNELNNLGIFKGKEKKALQLKIDELTSKLPTNDAIESEKVKQINKFNNKLSNIKSETALINDRITNINKRINEINTELTKER